MLHDLEQFFTGISWQGAILLLFVGYMAGAGLHGYVVAGWESLRLRYARAHDVD